MVVHDRRMRNYGHKLKQDRLTIHEEKNLHCEGDLALKQVIQKGCEIFSLRGFHDLSGKKYLSSMV